MTAPSDVDPYRHCAVYLANGACVCSTGYPSSCTADDVPRCETCGGDGGDPDDAGWSFQGHLEPGSRGPCPTCDGSGRADVSGPEHYGWQKQAPAPSPSEGEK